MGNNRGQASILIAILFQVLFIFFAMVVNVGLIVHDKINLQNSVDIAAYYGALKQAQVLNTMAHVNYQIRQSWKLFNYRLWVLGDAGRNADFRGLSALSVPQTDNTMPYQDKTCNGAQNTLIWPGCFVGPVVCLGNAHWGDFNKVDSSRRPQNLCQQPTQVYTALKAMPLNPFQAIAPGLNAYFITAVAQSQANAKAFNDTFQGTGSANYITAVEFLVSYKMAVAHRRIAMHKLQDLLVNVKGSDFTDLGGKSVSQNVKLTFQNNLSAANAQNVTDFEFKNGLNKQPFLVPIDVRSFVKYQDNYNNGNGVVAQIQNLNIPPQKPDPDSSKVASQAVPFVQPDYSNNMPAPSRQTFDSTDPSSDPFLFASLVGFEKDPWVMAWVSVKATTQPKMLFSPFSSSSGGGITLVAEAYAMPFGGKMGPWHSDMWPSGSDFSTGNPIDSLLPPRTNGAPADVPPNYSRYPGDTLGMKSRLARYMGLRAENGIPPWRADYQNVASNFTDPNWDPVVNPTITDNLLRQREVAAIAPDAFDAAYYSAQSAWLADNPTEVGNFQANTCGGFCYNLGSKIPPPPPPSQDSDFNIQTYVTGGLTPVYGSPPTFPPWNIHDDYQLNTSWTQADPGQYDGAGPNGNGNYASTMVGNAHISGGRSGYSVKLVSKQFLDSSSFAVGGNGSSGSLVNAP